MANYITIDGGTTNTRISLVCDFNVIDTLKYSVGAASESKESGLLKNTVAKGITDILDRNNMCEGDVERILASGMITSEFGLCLLEHLTTPCGVRELAVAMHEVVLEDISKIPFVFARGVKTSGKKFECFDMMRGEETELMGIAEKLEADCLYVLPGSHSKLVLTDNEEKICEFSTELTGELISAVSNDTILRNSVDLNTKTIDEAYLQKGYAFAKEKGINAAFFKVRILDKLLGCSKEEIYSFFIGAALEPEIENIINSDASKIVICGKRVLKNPTAVLAGNNSSKVIEVVDDNITEHATAYGVIRLYEYKCHEMEK